MIKRALPNGPSLRRVRATRAPKLRLYVFAEGENTEPGYLTKFAGEHGNSLVEVICQGGAVPATLVEKARLQLRRVRRSSNSFERSDQVWVVFDEDEHPEVKQSIGRARVLGVKVGYSNPCFEVWLLLHYKDHDAPDGRHKVQQMLAGFDDGYKRNGAKEPTYAALSSNYEQAKGRAKKMRDRRLAEGNALDCPYTDIDDLTEVIILNGRSRP